MDRWSIQHGAARDHKVNKDSCRCFFEYDQSIGHAWGIINTEQTVEALGCRYSTLRRVVISRGLANVFCTFVTQTYCRCLNMNCRTVGYKYREKWLVASKYCQTVNCRTIEVSDCEIRWYRSARLWIICLSMLILLCTFWPQHPAMIYPVDRSWPTMIYPGTGSWPAMF